MKRVVLVVPGMMCTEWHLSHLVEGLGKSFSNVLAVNPARVFQSSRRRELRRRSGALRAYAASLCDLIEERRNLEGQEVLLVGHSLGGLVCQIAVSAMDYPDWIRGCALLGSAAPSDVIVWSVANLRGFLGGYLGAPDGSFLLSRRAYSRLFMNQQSQPFINRVYSHLGPEWRRTLREVSLSAFRPQLTAVESTSKGNWLVVSGGHDLCLPSGVQERIAARYTRSKHVVIESADHYGLIGGVGSVETLAEVTAFFRERVEP